MLNFTNTATRRKEPFTPLHAGRVTMYTCGPTVHNFAHIGNFRAMLAFDLVKRWLRARGLAVTHVMNVTDIDDKTISGARQAGVPLAEFTARFTSAFFEDCATLRLLAAEHLPRATQHIPGMLALIQRLLDAGVAYAAQDGSVYFSIERYPGYGRLSHLDTREVQHGARVASDEYDKDHAADFVLWKAWTNEDGDVRWESPWGPGRPGWHLECSVMAQHYLGDTIDIHMGGEDLVFPHHENEIAQSEAATGKPFARYWLHNAHLLVEGRKMSKSLGNFYTLRDLLVKGYTGREIRYVLLSVHYRQPLNFTLDGLHAARSALQRLDDARTALQRAAAGAGGAARADVSAAVAHARQAWTDALDDDLNISPALAALFDLVHQANKWLADGQLGAADAAAVLAFMDDANLVLAAEPEADTAPADVVRMAEERAQARREKNWGRADELRAELTARGYAVEDTPHGPRVKRL